MSDFDLDDIEEMALETAKMRQEAKAIRKFQKYLKQREDLMIAFPPMAHPFIAMNYMIGHFLSFLQFDMGLVMGDKQMLFIHDLMNRGITRYQKQLQQNKGSIYYDEDNYFMCSREFLENTKMGLSWTNAQQRSLFDSLKALGFVSLKFKRGKQGTVRRWVRLESKAITKAIMKARQKLILESGKKGGEQMDS